MASWDTFKAGLKCIFDSKQDTSGLRPAEALSFATESNSYALVHATETYNTSQDIPLMRDNGDGFWVKDLHFDRNIDVVEKIVVKSVVGGVAKASLLIGSNEEFPLVAGDHQRTHFVFKHRVTLLLGALKARDVLGNKDVSIRCYFDTREYHEFRLSYDALLLHAEPRHTLATQETWMTATHVYHNGVASPVVIEDRDPVRPFDVTTASWYSGLPAGTYRAPTESSEDGEDAPAPSTDLLALLAALHAKFDALEKKLATVETKLDTRLGRIEGKLDDVAAAVDALCKEEDEDGGDEDEDGGNEDDDAEETFRKILGEANERAEDGDAVRLEKGNEDEEKVLDSGYLYNHRFRIQGVRVDE
jgi:hypothetical protein